MAGPTTLDELNVLRREALELLERCLSDQTSGWLESFIEANIARNPPPVQLLSEVAEAVHYRLLELRQSHFEMRERAVQSLREGYGVNLRHVLPARVLEDYHRLDADQMIDLLHERSLVRASDAPAVRDLLLSSVDVVRQIYNELVLAEHLYRYVDDWLNGLRVLSVQTFWGGRQQAAAEQRVH